MESYMAHEIHPARYSYLDVDAADCLPSSPFSHHSEDTSYYQVVRLQDPGPLRKTRSLSPQVRHDTTRADDQRLFSYSKYAHILDQSLPPPCPFDSSPMDDETSPERAVSTLLPELLPPPHVAFFRPQPPSPPLDTPELVQRSLPALQDSVCPPHCLPLNTQDLPETLDIEMRDADDGHFSRLSTSRLSQGGRPTEDDFSPKRICLWHAAEAEQDISSPSGSSSSTSYPELLTPVTPTSFSWISEPPFPEEPVDSLDDLSFDYSMSTWAESSSSSSYDPVPSAYKLRSRSLEFQEINAFDPSTSAGPSYHNPIRAYTSPPGLITTCDEDFDTPWSTHIDDATAPRSPRPPSATLPGDTYEHSRYPQDSLPLEVDPPPGTFAPKCREPLSLPSLFDDDVYISPHSPRSFTARLPELEMEDAFIEPPTSPHSPYRELSPIEDDLFTQPATISPSLLIPQTGEGLGLFIQPSAIDPPLARSPSPDEDDLHFLDIQLDSASTSLPVDEFLGLRVLRRRALDAEREARSFEAELAERVGCASDALLPSQVCDAAEKRARKHELHVATEMRSEARKARKREKQRSKEIGALLDLKMQRNVPQGKIRSVAQLVANMVLKRRDVYRPLANRKPACAVSSLSQSPLHVSFAVEDLMQDDDAF